MVTERLLKLNWQRDKILTDLKVINTHRNQEMKTFEASTDSEEKKRATSKEFLSLILHYLPINVNLKY